MPGARSCQRWKEREQIMDFVATFRWLVIASLAGTLCFCCGCLKPELGGWCIRMAAKLLRSRGCCVLCCVAVGTLTYSMWHAPLDQFVFDSVSADADGIIEAALLRGRPLIVFRNRILESAGFAAESLDFIAALEDNFYIAVENDGQYDSAVESARPKEVRCRLDELLDGRRLNYVNSRPHIQIHLGAAGDFDCPDPETTFCVGRTMFETDRVPRTWVPKINSQHRVWVPSPFNLETFARAGVKGNKLRFIPEPIDTELFRPSSSSSDGLYYAMETQRRTRVATRRNCSWIDKTIDLSCNFVFLSVFAWNDRKGWDVLLRAFFSEFQQSERVCLLLRTYPKEKADEGDLSKNVREMIARYAQRTFSKDLKQLSHVFIIGYHLGVDHMPELYAAADAFVLPTRGEGWGRPIAEAMAMGIPAIVTNWSGHTLFANKTTSWPVPVAGLSCIDNVQHAGLYARHRWAEPSCAGLRRSMRQVYVGIQEQQPELLARVKAGQAVIAESYSRASVGLLMHQDLAGDSLSVTRDTGSLQSDDAEAEAVLRTAVGEINLDPDETLLRNLYDAATGRYPSWFERLWARHVGWRKQWKQFFCLLCFEATERNAAGYGVRYGGMCRVCKRSGYPFRTTTTRDSPAVSSVTSPTPETEDPRRLQQQQQQRIGYEEDAYHEEEEMVPPLPHSHVDETFWGGTIQTERAAFEAAWGRCHTAGGRGVLIALPYSDFMPCTLREKMFSLLKAMECANPGWNLYLALYDEPYHNEMDARKTKASGRGVLAHIRNIVIEHYLQPTLHEYVLWVDADVVSYPPNLITLLYDANPGGVTAPTVLIEDSNSEAYHSRCRRGICGGNTQTERHYQFYDRAAFIVSGTNITRNPSFPGNAMAFPPYLGGIEMWNEAKASVPSVIDCTIYCPA